MKTPEIDKKAVTQLLENAPSKAFARPEVHVTLLTQDWEARGLYSVQVPRIEGVSSGGLSVPSWNPRNDVVEYLADLQKTTLAEQGYSSASEFLLAGYASNMKKLGVVSGTFSEVIRRDVQQELPPTLGAYLKEYLTQRRQPQSDFADEIGGSQSLISNAVNNKPVSEGLYLIFEGLRVPDEVRQVAFDKYAPKRIKGETGVVLASHRGSWADNLYKLDKQDLQRLQFEGIESFLFTGLINTSYRLGKVIETLDALPEQVSSTDVDTENSRILRFPTVDEVTQHTGVTPALLRIWQAKGLFLPLEQE